MDLNSIRNALHEQPFKPFDLCLADGRRVPVKHPEFVAMNNRVVVVLDEQSFSTTIEPLLIVSLEPTAGNPRGTTVRPRSVGAENNRLIVIRRSLTKRDVETEPFRVWNAFVDLLAMEDYGDLALGQRPAHLVFWYETDVQNGGHLQYFENRGTEQLATTINALGLLSATCQQQVLSEAGKFWLSRSRPPSQTGKEFCDTALDGEFHTFDSRFHACSPTLQQCLESYLEQHQEWFVSVT